MATTHTARRDLFASVREVAAATYVWTLALLAGVVVAGVAVGYTPVVITSGSMDPAIRSGDVVLLREVGEQAPAPPSIVTFATGDGNLVTHRVVDNLPDGSVITKGDANAVRDSSPVAPERIVGVGRWLVPYVGLPVVWMRDGDLLLVVGFLLLSLWVGRIAVGSRTREDDEGPVSAALRRRQRAAHRRAGVAGLISVAIAVPVTMTSSATLTATTSSAATFAAAPATGPTTIVRYLGYGSAIDTLTEPVLPIVDVEPILDSAVNRSMDRDDRPGRWLQRDADGPAGRIDWRGLLPIDLRTIDGQVVVEVTAVARPHHGQGGGPAPRLGLTVSAYDLLSGERGPVLGSGQKDVPSTGGSSTVTFVLDVTAVLEATEGLEISLETDRRDVDVYFATTTAPSIVTIDLRP